MDELLGKAFGPYTIVEKIADGGMAMVYKGYQESLNRYVAIKVLRKELTNDQEFIARFRREALAAAKLSHPNILLIYDASVAHGWYYIAMEYVDGGSLKDLLAQGPLPIDTAIELATQLADALDYANNQGFVHRDVKPANVLMTSGGRPRLADFGIAQALNASTHLTRTGTSIGTPIYMAPEQAQGQATDGRTDIYALGIVLYEMLAGEPPFHAPYPMATLYKQVNEPLPPLRQKNAQIPPWLETVVAKALAKQPEDRYQRASDFANVLRRNLAPASPAATRPSKATAEAWVAHPTGKMESTPQRRSTRTTWILVAAVLIVSLVLLGSGAFLVLGNPAKDITPTAAVLIVTSTPSETHVPTQPPAPTHTPVPTLEPEPPTPTNATGTTIASRTSEPAPTSTATPSPPPITPSPQPTTPSPPPTETKAAQPTALPPTKEPGQITNFETFGTWRRGDEANGTFTQSRAQYRQGAYSGKLVYDFGTTDNDYVVFQQIIPIAGQPSALTAWVYGDGAGHFLNAWIKEQGGQVWQVPLGRVTHTGWQQMVGALDTSQGWPWTHISGADNGKIDYPISFQALVLDDNPDGFTGQGTLYIDDLRASTVAVSALDGGDSASPVPRPTSGAGVPSLPAGGLMGRIAFVIYDPGIGSYTLYIVRPDGSELHAVADYVHHPDLSPDGMRIAVDGVGGGKDDLWSLKVNGSDWRQITTHTDDHFPTWSPNSLIVAFSSTRQGDGVYRLYKPDSPIGTGTTKFVLGDFPVWIDTWEIVYSGCDYGWGTGARCGLWRVNEGRLPLQITDNPRDIPTDGNADEILFLRPDEENWEVYRIARAGGNPVRLTDNPGNDGPAVFSPDGQTIALLSTRSGNWALYTMSRRGDNVKKVLDLPKGGNLGAAPYPWTHERISWGPLPVQATPAPTAVDSHLLPAPQVTFPIFDDTVSTRRPSTIRWTWSRTLGADQGFEVRIWHTSEATPMGVAPPTTETQLEMNLGLTDAYRQHGEGAYYLDIVVVQRNPYRVLSKSVPIRIKADPSK
jgi:serine/threonine protein kinase